MIRTQIRFFCAVCLSVLILGASRCLAETMIVPCAVEGAAAATQYRYRDQTRIETDTPNVIADAVFLDTLYGDWSEWSE